MSFNYSRKGLTGLFPLIAALVVFIAMSCSGGSGGGDGGDSTDDTEDGMGIGGADDDTSDPGLPAVKVSFEEALT
ncbi:MAG: hypothetical protein HYU99_09380, partial [Deltaproteobacteria bacterium]|nr:hypothetical protein [Deltaproteobacteria bacterium]